MCPNIDCLKIIEDKSSDNKIHASDVRLIKATRPKLRCRAQNPRLNITAMPRRRAQGPCLSTTLVLRHTAWSPHLKREARDPHLALPQWLNAKLKPAFQLEKSLRLSYNYPYYRVKYCPRN